MDDETAPTPLATADNDDLAPELRAELQALAQGARETIRRAWSPHTHRAYAGAWRRFDQWTAQRGLESLPALPATLLLYLQTSRNRTGPPPPSGLRYPPSRQPTEPREQGAETPTVHEDVKSFLRGIEREGPPQRQAAAMMPGVIAAIQATARIPRKGRGGRFETPETAEARARVDVALALTLRDGGLRVSEAVALDWGDVERWPDGSGRLTIHRSKTDPTGEGAVVAVTPACVRSLEAIRPEDPENQGSVFQLAARQMANRIQGACDAAGLDGDAFSGHSGRVGLARMMSGAGAPTETTMRQGRWKSADMVRRYTRSESAGAALQWMDGGTEIGT